MCSLSISDIDDLEIRMAFWSIHLGLASQDGEHKDLNGSTCGIPERPSDSVSDKEVLM